MERREKDSRAEEDFKRDLRTEMVSRTEGGLKEEDSKERNSISTSEIVCPFCSETLPPARVCCENCTNVFGSLSAVLAVVIGQSSLSQSSSNLSQSATTVLLISAITRRALQWALTTLIDRIFHRFEQNQNTSKGKGREFNDRTIDSINEECSEIPTCRSSISEKVDRMFQQDLHPLLQAFIFSESLEKALQRVEIIRSGTMVEVESQCLLLRSWNGLSNSRRTYGQLRLEGYTQSALSCWSELPIYQLKGRNLLRCYEQHRDYTSDYPSLCSADQLLRLLINYSTKTEHPVSSPVPSGQTPADFAAMSDNQSSTDFLTHLPICATFIIDTISREKSATSALVYFFVEFILKKLSTIASNWIRQNVSNTSSNFEKSQLPPQTESSGTQSLNLDPLFLMTSVIREMSMSQKVSAAITDIEKLISSRLGLKTVGTGRKLVKSKSMTKSRNNEQTSEGSGAKKLNQSKEETVDELKTEEEPSSDQKCKADASDSGSEQKEVHHVSTPALSQCEDDDESQGQLERDNQHCVWVPSGCDISGKVDLYIINLLNSYLIFFINLISDPIVHRNRRLAFNSWYSQLSSLISFSLATFRQTPQSSSVNVDERLSTGAPTNSSVVWLPPGRRQLLFSATPDSQTSDSDREPSIRSSIDMNCFAVLDDRVVMYLNPERLPTDLLNRISRNRSYICRLTDSPPPNSLSQSLPPEINSIGSFDLLSTSDLQVASSVSDGKFLLPKFLLNSSTSKLPSSSSDPNLAVPNLADPLSDPDELSEVSFSLNLVQSLDELPLPSVPLQLTFDSLSPNRSLGTTIELTLSIPRFEFLNHLQRLQTRNGVCLPPWHWEIAPSLQRYLTAEFIRSSVDSNYLSAGDWMADLMRQTSRESNWSGNGTGRVTKTRELGRRDMRENTATSESESGESILSHRIKKKKRLKGDSNDEEEELRDCPSTIDAINGFVSKEDVLDEGTTESDFEGREIKESVVKKRPSESSVANGRSFKRLKLFNRSELLTEGSNEDWLGSSISYYRYEISSSELESSKLITSPSVVEGLPRDSQKFLCVWEVSDKTEGLRRVCKYRRRVVNEKLKILRESMTIARRLYRRWRRSVLVG